MENNILKTLLEYLIKRKLNVSLNMAHPTCANRTAVDQFHNLLSLEKRKL